MASQAFVGYPPGPIDLGISPSGLRRIVNQLAVSFLALSGDAAYSDLPADLHDSLPHGILFLSDGTTGGLPLSGIDYGIPNAGLIQWNVTPSGIEGDSLAAFMREFPRYTRISWDRTSMGGQIFTAISRLSDELIEAGIMANRSRFPMSHPLYEQGLVYEWNFNDAHDLESNPGVSGRLGNSWFDIPLVRDEQTFWTSPPTRLETTSAEIDNLTVLNWTQVGASGLIVMLNELTNLSLHNQIVVEVSGAKFFSFKTETAEIRGTIYIRGHWPHDGFRPRDSHMEEIPVYANAPITSRNMYRAIERVEVRGVDPAAYVRIRILDFQSRWKSDSIISNWSPQRGELEERIFWQLINHDASFSGIVQPENHVAQGPASQAYLARTRLLNDTIFDQDLEWNILETWKISDPNGVPLSGIVDIAPIPNARFLLLLGADSNVWVIDTFRPAINMKGFAETNAAPARIQLSYPKDSSETPSHYSVDLDVLITNTADGVQRWRWAVHHHDSIDIIYADGSIHPYHHASGWQSGSDELTVIPKSRYIISGAGQYVFELAMVTDNNARYQTYAGYQQVEKRALGGLPIRGLTQAPSGIEFDSYGRPWVGISGNAIRLIMHTDTGIWLPDQRVLLTRESYHEVRKS